MDTKIPMETASDVELAQQLAAGDRTALEELYIRYHGSLCAMAASHLADAADVQDVVQDAFIDAAQGITTYDPEYRFYPWLRAICLHRLYKHLRFRRTHRSRDYSDLIEILTAPVDAAEALDDEEKLRALRICVQTLSPEHRSWLERRYVDGIALSELAEKAGRNINALTVAIHRVRCALRACIERTLGVHA
jgi:RNA polymerase sigma-70 factor, ECF subfamily